MINKFVIDELPTLHSEFVFQKICLRTRQINQISSYTTILMSGRDVVGEEYFMQFIIESVFMLQNENLYLD